MMTPEERAIAEEAERIFSTHICVVHRYTDFHREIQRFVERKVTFCLRDGEPWPCKAIERARELTADLAEEVD
jgi:hypothetical protein